MEERPVFTHVTLTSARLGCFLAPATDETPPSTSLTTSRTRAPLTGSARPVVGFGAVIDHWERACPYRSASGSASPCDAPGAECGGAAEHARAALARDASGLSSDSKAVCGVDEGAAPLLSSEPHVCSDACTREPGALERLGVLAPGLHVHAINGRVVERERFTDIVDMLQRTARPTRITFRDPEQYEFRDRFGFIRSKLHVDRETEYFRTKGDERAKANDLEWIEFLSELGSVTKLKGTSFGVQRLVRDANGELAFPLDPSARLNAMSPLHGRMLGISGSTFFGDEASGGGERAAAGSARTSGAGRGGASPPAVSPRVASGAAGASSASVGTSSAAGSKAATLPDSAAGDDKPTFMVPIVMYNRVWSPTSIGVSMPPGLAVALHDPTPKPKQAKAFHTKLRQLVLQGGVPTAFRPAIWYELSGAHAKAALHPPGYYEALLRETPKLDDLYALQKDIDRTFPNHEFFASDAGLAALTRVLTAFAVHNPSIGYCQGLNFVAGFLLLVCNEEIAFWCLDVLVNEILPPHYYNEGLQGVHIDQRVLAHLVHELIPDVSEAFLRAGIQLHVLTVEWFMCLLVTSMPIHTACRVWDALFLCGSEVLFRVVISLFSLNKSRIMSVANSSTQSGVVVRSLPPPPSGASSPGMSVIVESASASGSAPGEGGGGKGSGRTLKQFFGGKGSSGGASSGGKDTIADTAARVLSAAAAAITNSPDFWRRQRTGGAVGTPSFRPVDERSGGGAAGGGGDQLSPLHLGQTGDDMGVELASIGPSASASSSTPKATPGAASATVRTSSGSTPVSPPTTTAAAAAVAGAGAGAGGSTGMRSPPVASGGTVRSHTNTFSALYTMLKSMPTQAFDPDELMAVAYPPTPHKDAIEWGRYLSASRLAKLRVVAKAAVHAEMGFSSTSAVPARISLRRAAAEATSIANGSSSFTPTPPSGTDLHVHAPRPRRATVGDGTAPAEDVDSDGDFHI